MRVAITPFSDLERSESLQVYKYFKNKGADITAIYWGDPQIPQGVSKVKIEIGQEIPGLDDFDLIVRGPAVHPRQLNTKTPITSLTNIFMEECPSKNIIGITGTKGKGTSSTLTARLLEAAGKKVWLGGNIGHPLLDDLKNIKPDDWVVLEMAAAQLLDIKFSPRIAACLMLVPEHLDWHTDFKEYLSSKQNLFKYQSSQDTAIYNVLSKNSSEAVSMSPGRKLGYEVPPVGQIPSHKEAAYVEGDNIYYAGKLICPTSSVALLGRHNLENVCAAISVTWDIIGGNTDVISEVISSFKGLPHRIELVRELDGVKYYDDSFATTPETSIACLKAFPGIPKTIILGGSDKGIPFDDLADEVVRSDVRQVILVDNHAHEAKFGNPGPVIDKLLRDRGFDKIITGLSSMPEIVKVARQHSAAGTIVLLSTGCASFGLFKDYQDRGDQFKAAVNSL